MKTHAKVGSKLAVAICAAAMVFGAAASSITIDSVTQRWPWNNKVDITYTVNGGQDVASGVYCRIVFNATLNGETYVIDGVTNVGASASSGTHTVTWNPPSGIKAQNCTMTATLLSADNPSGDDYMIIDLATGAVTYEGLLASQAASNARYNTATYKTGKLVLRKVPCTAQSVVLPNGPFASGYPTGDDTNYANTNGRTNWVTKTDYYMAIFPVTQSQLAAVMGSDPYSTFTTDDGEDLAIYRPVDNIAYSNIRGSTDPSVRPTPKDASGRCFLERLNGRTQNACGVTGFDLPTEIMFEIAQRAGNEGTYAYTDVATYVICGGLSHTYAVGTKSANPWGLYDTTGNIWEWCLDDNSRVNLKDASDPWTAANSGSGTIKYSLRGGGAYSQWSNAPAFQASYRNADTNQRWKAYGFRVAFIVK